MLVPLRVFRISVFAGFWALLIVNTAPAWGQSELKAAKADPDNKLTVSTNLRLRLEQDFNSQRSDGSLRDDRLRLRTRFRAGLKYEPTSEIQFEVRVRSGSLDSQQSPHITLADFDDNDTGDAELGLDKWYAQYRKDRVKIWLGRNSFPFSQTDELLWDDDATMLGAYSEILLNKNKSTNFKVKGGYFKLPAGLTSFSGTMFAAQLEGSLNINASKLSGSAGIFSINSDPDDFDNQIYLQDNGLRDYQILTSDLGMKSKIKDVPFEFGGSVLLNIEDYSDSSDPFTVANQSEDFGFVSYATVGNFEDVGDLQFSYYYAEIEQFAVNNSYSQDDWLRFGNATQTRSSNFTGHQFRFKYKLTDKIELVARTYFVESITSSEDGNRFRFDMNVKF